MIHPSPPRACLSPQYPEVAKDKRSQYPCRKEYSYLRHNSCQKCDHHFSPRQLLHCPTTPVVPPSAAQSNWSQEGNRAVLARTSGSISEPHSGQGMPRAHFETHSPRAPMEQPETLAFVGDIDQVARLALASNSDSFSQEASWFQGSFHAPVSPR